MSRGHYLLLCGGVGGSKCAEGLAQILAPNQLTIAVNTGDDFTHLGLHISPDLDTVLYMLAGVVSRERGWGREDESWAAHETLGRLGGADWFMLGDRDIALHLIRSEALRQGQSLSEVTRQLARRFGISALVTPLSDEPVPTRLTTEAGELDFQDYFVRRRGEVRVSNISYGGSPHTKLAEAVTAALSREDLAGVIIAPSNPWLSIGPMLACAGLRERLSARRVPVVAISPYVKGEAVKGPVARVQQDLGFSAGDSGVLRAYAGLIDLYIADEESPWPGDLPEGISLLREPILMRDGAERRRVAEAAIAALRRFEKEGRK